VSWSARARAADIEAAGRRKVRSTRRSSTVVVGSGTSLRARDESKPIVALFSRHLFPRVKDKGEFGLVGQVAFENEKKRERNDGGGQR